MAPWNRSRTVDRPAYRARVGSVPRAALSAAAYVLGQPKDRGRQEMPNRKVGWQEEVWGYYDAVPEFHNMATFVANAMSRLRLRPGWLDDDDNVIPVDDKNAEKHGIPAEAVRLSTDGQKLLRNLRAPTGGQKRILYRLGLNLVGPAECYLLATDTMDPNGRKVLARHWEVLSVDELRPAGNGDGFVRYRGPGLPPKPLPENSMPVRIWIDHPRYSVMADSPMRPLLDTMESLTLLRREVRGTTVSRLAGPGVMFIPSEVTWEDDPTVPESEAGNPIQYKLQEAMMTAIGDKGSAAGVVPITIDMPAEMIDKVKHFDFRTGADVVQIEKRNEAVETFARGAPLPVEQTTGHAATTFANAGQIDEDTYKSYIQPFAESGIDSLVAGYYHPQLMAFQGLDPLSMPDEITQRCVIYIDPSDLITPPDRTKEAFEANDRLLISNAATLRHIGFPEEDAPDEKEIQARVRILQQKNSRETLRGIVSTSAEDTLIVPDPEAPPTRPGMRDLPPPDQALPSHHSVDPDQREEEEPPAQPTVDVSGVPEPVQQATQQSGQQTASAITAMVRQAVERCAERSGQRLRQKANGRLGQDTARRIAETPAHLIPCVFDSEMLERMIPIDELVAGEFTALRRTVCGFLAETGLDEQSAAEIADRVAAYADVKARARLRDPAVKPWLADIARILGE
jgi:hypothetical protein